MHKSGYKSNSSRYAYSPVLMLLYKKCAAGWHTHDNSRLAAVIICDLLHEEGTLVTNFGMKV